MYIAGATDGPVFLTYLKRVLVPRRWKGAVVVMDNLGAHQVKAVQAQIEAAGARLPSLPPHSADLHPVESAWSQFNEPPARQGGAHPAPRSLASSAQGLPASVLRTPGTTSPTAPMANCCRSRGCPQF